MLYLTNFSDWSAVSFHGTAGLASVEQILEFVYPSNVIVPNQGMDLKLFGTFDIYSPVNLTTPVLAVTTSYEVNSSKNSINTGDYIIGSSGAVQIFLEVG
jgi:hypothetical protein